MNVSANVVGIGHMIQSTRRVFVSTPPTARRRLLRATQGAHVSHSGDQAAAFHRRKIVTAAPFIVPMLLAGGRSMASTVSSYPEKAEDVLVNPQFPEAWPYGPEAFQRYDESPDSQFYGEPRFVTHIDDMAIKALTEFYETSFPKSGTPGTALLDMCSSWISHYPKGYKADKISGAGMNEEELKRNSVLTDYVVQDLNENPSLPYEDNTFDVVTNAVSIDYMNKPLEVMKEVHRVLKPGGLAIMSFSNRCFPTKAVAVWTSTGDLDHIWIVGSYFHYAGGFEPPMAKEITKKGLLGTKGDPMYVVYSRKQNVDF